MIRQDPPGKLYQKRTKAMYARVFRGTMTYDAYVAWKRVAKQKLKLCRNNQITLEEFGEWLSTLQINPH